ncbi:NADPH:quinone reductase [Streptomyces roseochromogenus subsp. oscitans DS 12.976]|uniref:NADPH:quinone reductase n=2 Tax=Streptomyces roseochromogenus TaxID=285450 RepID=V6JNQ4_STRRC|nr:NADPH:quinone reductase [Streptomyces roseochromogenus subsp. oscitans DS 12.976]
MQFPSFREFLMSTAITFSEYGAPGVLTLSEVPTPEPGPGQVRVRVRAAAVNPIDVRIRAGMMQGVFPVEFPMIPGWDVAGVVDKAGEEASFTVGDEVFGVAAVGGYSEFALLDRPFAKPKELSFETAAGLITVGEAAYRALEHLGVGAGQTLLIHGAGGSVGTIAVQLAAARGIAVVGTVAEQDVERVNRLGATAVRYGEGWVERVKAAAAGGVDFVFDASGAGVLAESVALAGDAGRVITIADPSFAQHGVRFTGMDPADRFPEALPQLAGLIAAGKLDVPVWRAYPLAEAAQAHADIEARRNEGKVVLLP